MEKIASNTEIAEKVVAEVTSVDIGKGQQVFLEKSTVAGIKTGVDVNNQLITDLSQLIECVQAQSEKFSEVAELMAFKDSQIKFEGRE